MRIIHGMLGTLACFALSLTGCEQTGTFEDADRNVEAEALAPEVEEAVLEAVDRLEADYGKVLADGPDLRQMLREDAAIAVADVDCPLEGLLAGLWSSAQYGRLFEGFFLQLGGPQEGILGGTWAPLDCLCPDCDCVDCDCCYCPDGTYEGDWASLSGREGLLGGHYAAGEFWGDWYEVEAEDVDALYPRGEMSGIYHRINEYGGYFIGVWTLCTDAGDAGLDEAAAAEI